MKKYIENIKDISDINILVDYLKQGVLSGYSVKIIEDVEIEPEDIIWVQEYRAVIECCINSKTKKYSFNEGEIMQIIESIDCARDCCKPLKHKIL
jgi:hypothetical protein